jgi:hypothetical protein
MWIKHNFDISSLSDADLKDLKKALVNEEKKREWSKLRAKELRGLLSSKEMIRFEMLSNQLKLPIDL